MLYRLEKRAGGRAWREPRALSLRRRASNCIFLRLSLVATLFGLGWLGHHPGTLLYEGFSRHRPNLFTESTPRAGPSGGLLNAIVGCSS